MAQPECASTSTKYGYQQLHNVETALGQLERVGFGPGTEAYDTLWRERGSILGHIGYKVPKIDYSLSMWREFSPQRVRAWFDPEAGWFAEIRDSAAAPPRYKMVSFEVAAAIMKGEVTPEQQERLLALDEYLGE